MLSSYLIIFTAKYLIYFGILAWFIVGIQLEEQARKQFIIYSAVTLPLAYILAKIVGHLYYNPRPFVVGNFTPLIAHANDNGFPSDHTLLASALAITLLPFSKKWAAVLGVVAVLIGSARVLAGVHHAVDIMGSIILTVVSAGIVYIVLKNKMMPTKVVGEEESK